MPFLPYIEPNIVLKIGSLSRSATTGTRMYARNQIQETMQMYKEMRHRILMWKTQMWEKPRQRTGCRKIPLSVRDTTSRKHRGNDLLSSSSPYAAVVTLWRQRPLSLTLTLSLTLCTRTFTTMQQQLLNYIKCVP